MINWRILIKSGTVYNERFLMGINVKPFPLHPEMFEGFQNEILHTQPR